MISLTATCSYDFQGNREREWILDSVIRYIKVVGGAIGREGLLVGLKDGKILKIFVDNPFPQLLLNHTSCIRCLDMSMSRRSPLKLQCKLQHAYKCEYRQLAVVDDTSSAVMCVMNLRSLVKCDILCRYDLVSGRETYRDSNVSSVAFNSVFASPFRTLQPLQPLLCFNASSPAVTRTCCATAGKTPCPFARQTSSPTGGRFPLCLKTANVLKTCCREKLVGFVVGVKGSKVFCLQMDSMKTFDVRSNHQHICAYTTDAVIIMLYPLLKLSQPSVLIMISLHQVPQSASMHKFIQKGDLAGAKAIALLGVTESDWRLLGRISNATTRN